MYDENIKTVELTSDEVDLLKEVLFPRLEQAVSIGEEMTILGLLEKL